MQKQRTGQEETHENTLQRLFDIQNEYLGKPTPSALEVLGKLTKTPLEHALSKWVTHDPLMNKVKDKVRCIMQHSPTSPVLITGPTGTGKELVARAFHKPGEPFIAQNCGGMPTSLIHSLFFGHVKGAFTGATAAHQGLLVSAGNGILFLDEIADLPPESQALLLRAIQESEIYPLGSVEPVRLSCRFIAATKENLRQRVEQGTFREDLFARLYTFELRLTGLAERPSDIEIIAKSMNWTEDIPDLARQDIYKFNVRGIQNFIARMRTYGYYEKD